MAPTPRTHWPRKIGWPKYMREPSHARGIALSLIGMGLAAAGYLPPVAGAIMQEVIDVVAVLNALRVAFPPKTLTDY
jgi:hypothetical protein